ncbi:MAG: sigma-54-dependent Fis family transcriptional regulator [Firmicutes bacterium HGW-Firmicutes-12]|jgi:transcriptional regulator with PAS, ATPase and Fis domain|nr:MAG: sigma-54-dependent Fis family transcriptional regulator [Firmicutes bacterium HGW-Firmicutes-12]
MLKDQMVLGIIDALSAVTSFGIMVVDKEGKVFFINEIFAEITKINKAENIGKDFKEVFTENKILNIFMPSKISNDNYHLFDNRIFKPEDISLFSGNEIIGKLFMFVDVTEVKEVESELREVTAYKKMLEAVLESDNEGIVIVDKEAKILMLNRTYSDFLNVNPEEAVGKHVVDVIENTRMHQVILNGQTEIGKLQQIGKHNSVVNRLPIKINNEVVAGVGKIWFKDLSEVEALLNQLHTLEDELAYYKEELRKTLNGRYTLESIKGNSALTTKMKNTIQQAAASNTTVLITGESGTGKELVAHAIHNLSRRRNQPFVRINCAAVPENILESELFGYVEGAFTGAQKGGKFGKFESANKGTVLLDEIGDMSYNMQAKLLRFLQEKEFDRLGDNKTRQVNVRIIGATNQDLQKKIKNKSFREDLYYRLQVMNIEVPSLRERKQDIPEIVKHFLEKFNIQFGRLIRQVDTEVLNILCAYNWPGNIRQLENVIERAYNVSEGDLITKEALPLYLQENIPANNSTRDNMVHLVQAREALEKKTIENALQQVADNRSQAARMLGITRTSLYQKLKKYGLA